MKPIITLSLVGLLACCAEPPSPTPPSQRSPSQAPASPGSGRPDGAAQAPADPTPAPPEPDAAPKAQPSGPFMPPLQAMARGADDVRLIEAGPCAAADQFDAFTGGMARRARYASSLGAVEAVSPCDGGRALWVDLYPDATPTLRYRIFYVEGGLALEQRSGDAWARLCDGSKCGAMADQGSAAAWIRDHIPSPPIKAAALKLLDALPAPPPAPPVAQAPIFGPGEAPWPLLTYRGDQWTRLWPDGRPAQPLAISVKPAEGRAMRGRANDRPLLSPDGQRLAVISEAGLQIINLAPDAAASPARVGPEQSPLIHSWSPSGRRLLVYSRAQRRFLAVDPAQAAPQALNESRGLLGWAGDDGLLVQRGAALVKAPLAGGPEISLATLASEKPVAWADLRGDRLIYAQGQQLHARGLEGQPVVSLTGKGEYGYSPLATSPDGARVAFVATSPKAGAGALYLIDTATGARTPALACGRSCDLSWYTARVLLVRTTDGRVVLIDRDGARSALPVDGAVTLIGG